jgi:DNA-directed RNA polymerase specialized sigma24 family protein
MSGSLSLNLEPDGNDNSWEQIVSKWTPALQRYLVSQVPTKENIEDIIDETFLELVRILAGEGEQMYPKTLRFAIAKRKAKEYGDIWSIEATYHVDHLELTENIGEFHRAADQTL